MAGFVEYVESTFKGVADDGTLYRYKQNLIAEMTQRANTVLQSGLQDEKVLNDLIISEYPDLREDYRLFSEKEQAKKKAKKIRGFLTAASAGYVLLLTIIYLGVSFLTKSWGATWLIMEGGVTLLLVVLFSMAIKSLRKKRRAFNPIARMLIVFNIFLITTFAFLCGLVLFQLTNAWMLFLGAVIVAFGADAVFAAVTKQKLAVLNYLLYIPGATAILYVMLGLTGAIPWHPGWLLMLLAVLVDIAIIAGVIINNSKYIYKQEVEDVWNEN